MFESYLVRALEPIMNKKLNSRKVAKNILYWAMDEKFISEQTVPVEKLYTPEVPSSPRLLFRIFITVTFLTLTHPSRHKNFPEHPEKDAWVEI
jgi:hypothetical protein